MNRLRRGRLIMMESAAAVTYTISGTVYDADGTTPVEGATVALGELTAISAANGAYTISNVPPGTSGLMACTKSLYYFPPITVAMTGNLTANYSTVNPKTLLAPLYWFCYGNNATKFRDAARTIPVSADGQEVLGVADLSGNNNHRSGGTTTSPLHKVNIENGLSAILFDGINDLIATASLAHGVGTGDFYLALVVRCLNVSGYHAIWSNTSGAPTLGKRGTVFSDYWGAYHDYAGGSTATVFLESYRASGVLHLAINGVEDANTFNVATSMANAPHRLGGTGAGGEYGNSYVMDEAFKVGLPSAPARAAMRAYITAVWGF